MWYKHTLPTFLLLLIFGYVAAPPSALSPIKCSEVVFLNPSVHKGLQNSQINTDTRWSVTLSPTFNLKLPNKESRLLHAFRESTSAEWPRIPLVNIPGTAHQTVNMQVSESLSTYPYEGEIITSLDIDLLKTESIFSR
ncbi:MAG: hypothetical protein AAF655_09710 [Bacteroidota bacterium]